MGFFSTLLHGKNEGIYKYMGISGMVCEHCSNRVKTALEEVPGVTKVKVNLLEGQARVALSEPVSDEVLLKAVVQAGYAVTAISDTKLAPQ